MPRGTYSDISAGRTRRRCGTEMTRYCFPKAPSEEGRSVSEYPMRPHERPSGTHPPVAGSEMQADKRGPPYASKRRGSIRGRASPLMRKGRMGTVNKGVEAGKYPPWERKQAGSVLSGLRQAAGRWLLSVGVRVRHAMGAGFGGVRVCRGGAVHPFHRTNVLLPAAACGKLPSNVWKTAFLCG